MPDKLTDSEIVKALEYCAVGHSCKGKCPLDDDNDSIKICTSTLSKSALDLINRLQAENKKNENIIRLADKTIATLQAENEGLKNAYKQCAFERDAYIEIENTAIAEAKAEAYKECIEKVKEEIAEALKSNYKARAERIAHYENKGEMFVGDRFVDYCDGKINCLRGLDDFLDNTLKELVGE